MENITWDEFKKIEVRVGTIIEVKDFSFCVDLQRFFDWAFKHEMCLVELVLMVPCTNSIIIITVHCYDISKDSSKLGRDGLAATEMTTVLTTQCSGYASQSVRESP